MDIAKFSARLKQARNSANMTQSQLAEKAGMTQSKVSTYESEKCTSVPGLDAAAALAAALGVSLDWLAGISDELKPTTEISGRDFLKQLIDLLLHDEASRLDKIDCRLSGNGLYIHFGDSLYDALDESISNLFKLREATKNAGLPEDIANTAISATIAKILDQYGDAFEIIPF